jgi:hypothetical protein
MSRLRPHVEQSNVPAQVSVTTGVAMIGLLLFDVVDFVIR